MIPDPTFLDVGTLEPPRSTADSADETGPAAARAPLDDAQPMTEEELDDFLLDPPPVIQPRVFKIVPTIFYEGGRMKPLPPPDLDD